MDFKTALEKSPFIIAEGGTTERINREFPVELDNYIVEAGLVYDSDGKAYLEQVYRDYLDIGYKYNLPSLVVTPTWRANPERLRQAGFGEDNSVNRDCCLFLSGLRSLYGEYARSVYIGGSIACRGNAYDPGEALSSGEAERFHALQIRELAETGVDFLIAYTLPAASEALGMARALAKSGKPYILSFVVRPQGTLLDGTPLHEAVSTIDSGAEPGPLCYMINCVHSSIFYKAITSDTNSSPQARERILGFQANTSRKTPEELDEAAELDAEEPGDFGRLMADVYNKTGIKIIGGCCGTDWRHIECMVNELGRV
ncbi:MAG: homocysteine S-methyltransferase family protein [Clostridiales bacterium]|nr:homocysteine S-methyltransferase family protein [Clostridiales bacterium]MCF8023177.1 homocysteine S-methyltransferase family protein [Clostridiales bacterium]